MNFIERKQEIIRDFDSYLRDKIADISTQPGTQNNKAKAVNALVNEKYLELHNKIASEPKETRQNSQIILNYCYAVKALDFRNDVWTYEYMALSRRVGELWERFCKAAWDHPSYDNVKRMTPPSFNEVINSIEEKVLGFAKDDKKQVARETMLTIKDLIGSINMNEDEMFFVDDVPHIIDFKSGFGSNEKGNMLRLRAVGNAYRLWNTNTKLLFLVRQTENNNYLNVIKSDGLWDVRCGDEAYQAIDKLTGSNFNEIRENCIDFENDFSDDFLQVLSQQQGNLRSYFEW